MGFVSRLSAEERRRLEDISDAFPRLKLQKELRHAVCDVAVDRLVLAEELLQAARRCFKSADYRSAIGRAYYAAYHSARVIVLWYMNHDTDGHLETLNALQKLLVSRKSVRDETGLVAEVVSDLLEARANRSVADYSPYESSREAGSMKAIPLTDGSWDAAAKFNLSCAERMSQGANRCIFGGAR
jgi:uncharacterized protein (UPF0332 family)